MTSQELRTILMETVKENETGLIVYSSWSVYGEIANKDNEYYQKALREINRNESLIQILNVREISILGFIAIPMSSFLKDEEMFTKFLNVCNSFCSQGVITTEPSNKVVFSL